MNIVGGAQWQTSDPRALTTTQQASVSNLYLFSCDLDHEIVHLYYRCSAADSCYSFF